MPTPSIADELVRAARQLRAAARDLNFTAPVTCVYNPLDYAWPAHEAYLRGFGSSPKRVVFLGMNPGPFGMAQTGVPFGEVAVISAIGLTGEVSTQRAGQFPRSFAARR
jgi:single-strand selective monofunctional uracil DNA glycosylase